jgi:hypothetical protein
MKKRTQGLIVATATTLSGVVGCSSSNAELAKTAEPRPVTAEASMQYLAGLLVGQATYEQARGNRNIGVFVTKMVAGHTVRIDAGLRPKPDGKPDPTTVRGLTLDVAPNSGNPSPAPKENLMFNQRGQNGSWDGTLLITAGEGTAERITKYVTANSDTDPTQFKELVTDAVGLAEAQPGQSLPKLVIPNPAPEAPVQPTAQPLVA